MLFSKWTSNFKEKLGMYDMILANLIAGDGIIEPEEKLDASKIAIGFSDIASESQISKYFVIRNFPDYIQTQLMDMIRYHCIMPGVKINFYIYAQPYAIRWDSAEMRNRVSIWKQYAYNQPSDVDVFEYRQKRSESLTRDRIILSTKYLNEADLDHKRTLFNVVFLVEISSRRDEESILNLSISMKRFKEFCNRSDIKVNELRVNMIDWISCLGIFSLKSVKEVTGKLPRKIMTDDILANFNGYKQGQVGYYGIPLGIDVMAKVPVIYKFKADPDAAENWLVCAESGGGKSYFVKTALTYLLADGFVVTVMDYEGDEYRNLANYIKADNPEDVKIISMGKGSAVYFDPMEIADLTGDPDVDNDLKENAIAYTTSIFRLIVGGLGGKLDQWEEKVLSNAIKRVYNKAGVTDDKSTWYKSKGLRIKMVYDEIKEMVRNKEFEDPLMDNIMHKAAVKIEASASTYFEEGEAKSGTFKKPMSVNELFKAKFIVFSFGMAGATSSQIDPIILALKQLSVANVAIQISNHCKYVRKCFNVKVWEEYQRWGEVPGSAEIISNAMTGGRKRGDVNFLITNDLQAILDDSNHISSKIRQNLTSMAIGKIKDRGVIKAFCNTFNVLELEEQLLLIHKASIEDSNNNITKGSALGSRYKYAFCLVLDNGKRAVVKVMLPQALRQSSLFRTGVNV